MAQDSSLCSFWDERYRQEIMPWESGQLPPAFSSHVAACLPAGGRVLIPGCGSGHEIAFLHERGYTVSAIDFSAEAVARACRLLGPDAGLVRQADFFSAEVTGQWDWVYERAFLCALPPRLWPDYAEKMARLVRPGGWLAGYFYLRDTGRGPPFGVAEAGLATLLGESFRLQQKQVISDALPVFAPDEYWLCWQRTNG